MVKLVFFAGGVLGKKFCLSGVYGAEGWHIWCWLNHCGSVVYLVKVVLVEPVKYT